ncbi:MAG: phosphatidate cytidylyltransferase [Chlamydiota bacterium]
MAYNQRMADLYKRFLISSLMLTIIVLLLAFSMYSWVSFLFVIAAAVFAGIGVWEYAQLAVAKGLAPASRLMITLAVAEVLAYFIALKAQDWWPLPVVVMVSSVVILFVRHFRDASEALVHIAVEFFGICYLAVPIGLMIGILYPLSSTGALMDGRWWFAYLIFVTKITDVGAYFVGRLWGKHKLAPVLSPKKTVEGAIAGFLCAWLASLGMYVLGNKFSHGMFHLTFLEATFLGMLIGVVGQVGDLSESLLKRDAFVKDSNRLPGLGGVLDMLDSLLLTAPALYFFLLLR